MSFQSWALSSQSCEMHLAFRGLDQNKNELQIQHYIDDSWANPKVVHTNPSGFSHSPTVTIDNDGNLIVAWLELIGSSSQLMYRVLDSSGEWRGKAVEFGSIEGEKTTPLLFRSISGNVYLSWVSDQNDFDDVFLSSWDSSNGWSKAKTLSLTNEFPDITPDFEYIESANGQLELSVVWQARSKGGVYAPQSYVIEQGLKVEVDQQANSEVCERVLSKIALPSNIKRGFMYVPTIVLDNYQRLRSR